MQHETFHFMLAKQGLDAGALTDAQYTLVLCVAGVSIFITPAMLQQIDRLDHTLARLPWLGSRFGPQIQGLSLEEEEKLRDHGIIVGHGRVGERVAEALRRHHIPVVIIERDHNVTAKLRRQGIPAICGDAVYAQVLVHAHPERARVLIGCLPDFRATQTVIANARAANPDLDIVARVTRQEEIAVLCALGAREAVEPEFEGSLELLRHTFKVFGLPEETVQAELSAMRQQMQCAAPPSRPLHTSGKGIAPFTSGGRDRPGHQR
jgi:CPA2 family monovalent cation:H+ antiporter-2